MVEEKNENSLTNDQGDDIPDWMREAGWVDDTGLFDESKPVFDNLDD